ncbi:hypothetical protein mflW37_5680 [Mesoplasma florum W37]|uniref:ISLre2 family transposase n=1 Tax=Mesoplasma florum TaxID=2151 RepID=A0AAD0HS65_MESFO|nr:hypothetical protein [Mesoplasma florum]AGY41635.1 hypothetical protein mflW37_5680 [Mesoplasma florum W37]AVN59843.1 hypothetical protein CG008_03025 [Mesoplasma florum]AVN65973.1 hypothetical protein MflW12_5680 [Mesoplasma florum]
MKVINQIEVFDELKDFHLNLLIDDMLEKIQELDLEIKNSDWRKAEGYYINGYVKRTILTSEGVLTFKRTKYKIWNSIDRKWNTKCLVDDYLQLEKYQKISYEYIDKILKQVSEGMKYKDIINSHPRAIIDKSTVSRIIKKMDIENLSEISADLDYQIPSDVDNYDYVYVSTDDAFLKLKEFDEEEEKLKSVKHRVRLAVLYLGVSDTKDDRNSKLVHKRIIYQINKQKTRSPSTTKFAELVREKIKEFYGDKERQVIVCGDGDDYIKKVAEELDAKLVLDFFHLKAKIRKGLPFTKWNNPAGLNQLCNLIMEDIKTDPFKAIEKLKILTHSATDNKKVLLKEAIRYIKNNLEGIFAYQEDWYNGCYTESNVYHFIKSISNSKSYAVKTFKNLIALRAGKINCLNAFDIWKHEKNVQIEINAFENKHHTWRMLRNKDFRNGVKNGVIAFADSKFAKHIDMIKQHKMYK